MCRIKPKTPPKTPTEDITLNWFGGEGTPDLPGLTQVIRAFQDQTHMATLVGDDDDCVFSLSETNRRRNRNLIQYDYKVNTIGINSLISLRGLITSSTIY